MKEARRLMRPFAVLAIVALAMVACNTTQQSATGKRQLVVAVPNTPKTLDYNTMSDAVEFESAWNVYDKLVAWKIVTSSPPNIPGADLGAYSPQLATSWEVATDNVTYTFHLRKGVKSFFGNEMTAADVKFTFQSGFVDNGVLKFLATINNLASADDVTVVDPNTIQFKLQKPSSIFIASLTGHAVGIIDSTEAKKHANTADPYALQWMLNHDIGFGPYHVNKLIPDQEVDYVANPNYWAGKPPFDTIVMKVVPDSAQRLQLLLRGDVDIAEALAPLEYQTVKGSSSKGVTVQSFTPGWWGMSLRFNPNIAPFNNPKLRQAIAYAVPYQDIVQQVYLGQAHAMKSYVPERLPGFDPSPWTVSTDMTKAKQLLSDAGYPNGLQVTFNYSASLPEEEQIGTLLQSSLTQIGVKALLNKVPAAQYSDGLFHHTLGFYVDYDSPLVPSAGYASWLWFNPASPIDYAAYNNPTVTQEIVASLADNNQASYLTTVKDIQARIAADNVWLYLAVPDAELATRSNISGYHWEPIGAETWYQMRAS